ncbi:hypothetical protein [Pseudoduganella sp. HUAS MS19]
MSRVLVIVGGLLAAVALLFAAYVWLALSYSYSEGERAGYLQKVSTRGWICKTVEAEMLLTSMPGAIPEKFEFTVRDEALAAQLSAATGKRVVVHYAQHKGIPTSCFGDTQYFAESVIVQP